MNKPIHDCGFFPFDITYPRLLVAVVYVVGAVLSHYLVLPSFGVCCRGFPGFPCVLCPFVRFCSFLVLSKPAWFWQCGRQNCWMRVISGGLQLAMLRRISFVSCSFFCYSSPLGHKKASKWVLRRFA